MWQTWWETSAASKAAGTRIGFTPRGTRRASSRCWRHSMPSGWPWPGAYGAQVPGIHQWLLNTYGLGGDSLRETFHRRTHEPTGPYQWSCPGLVEGELLSRILTAATPRGIGR